MDNKYPTNIEFEVNIKGVSHQVVVDIFNDQDEKDNNFRYTVEIFPPNQTKESFESAEFWGTYTNERGLCIQVYPIEWTDKDKIYLANYLKSRISQKVLTK